VTFGFLHSTHQETTVLIPQIGIELLVRVPAGSHPRHIDFNRNDQRARLSGPLHRHRETEIFYVLEVRYLFRVDGKHVPAGTGDVAIAPGGSARASSMSLTNPPVSPSRFCPALTPSRPFRGWAAMHDGALDQALCFSQ
jgi:hypothetical protein